MSHSHFKQAIAAKIQGDDAEFDRLIREAVVLKTKSIVSLKEGVTKTVEFFIDNVKLPGFVATRYNLPKNQPCYFEGTIETYYTPAAGDTQVTPGHDAELQFEIKSAVAFNPDNERIPFDPQQLMAILTQAQVDEIRDRALDDVRDTIADDETHYDDRRDF